MLDDADGKGVSFQYWPEKLPEGAICRMPEDAEPLSLTTSNAMSGPVYEFVSRYHREGVGAVMKSSFGNTNIGYMKCTGERIIELPSQCRVGASASGRRAEAIYVG